MLKIHDYNFKKKRVLLRADLNVPLNHNLQVADTHRIEAIKPTVEKILQDRGSIILMSHLGRPGGCYVSRYSLRHILPTLKKILGTEILFARDCIGSITEAQVARLNPGEILLLENLRFYSGEQKRDVEFAQSLAALGDIYVNEAFGVLHRNDSSITLVPKYFDVKMVGYLVEKEVKNIQRFLNYNTSPVSALIGGAKVSDKLILLEALLDFVDYIVIGGAMAYTFIHASGGYTGASLVEKGYINDAKNFLYKAKARGVSITLPSDSIVANKIAMNAKTTLVSSYKIPEEWIGVDIGMHAIKAFQETICKAQTILWNGPMGVCEIPEFSLGTQALVKKMAEHALQYGVLSLVGGGETGAIFRKLGLEDTLSHLSTGGGAMLKYIEKNTLVGLQALNVM